MPPAPPPLRGRGGGVKGINASVLGCHRSPILRKFIYFSKEVTEKTNRILAGFKRII